MTFNGLNNSLLCLGVLSGTTIIDNIGHFKYIHGVEESASQYLTVLNFINSYDKSNDLFTEMIIIFEKIINDSYESEDIVKVGRFINSYPLNRLVSNFFPKEVNEIDNIISDMTADELKLFINDFKMQSDNDENVEVLIAYLSYYLDEKRAYEQRMRYVPSTEEKAASRFDCQINMRLNNEARFHAIKRASSVRM